MLKKGQLIAKKRLTNFFYRFFHIFTHGPNKKTPLRNFFTHAPWLRTCVICLDECLVSDWKVFGGCMKRVSCKIYISNHFFVCKYLIRMVRTGWAKTGLVSSCLDMSGQNILFQKVLDLNIFGIQNILGDKKFFNPKFVGLRIIFLC